ncbi:hypothetical protein DHD80_03030 [Gramella sp. AN32]|nr:hypothetical protein [Gramella sp. AN32]
MHFELNNGDLYFYYMKTNKLRLKLEDIEKYEDEIIDQIRYSYALKELFDYPLILITGKERLTTKL